MSSVAPDFPLDEPSWLYNSTTEGALAHESSAQFLSDLDEEDFSIFVLAYGLGMRFGSIARTLRIDPALVVWRLRRAFERWRRSKSNNTPLRCLETGVTQLLRADNVTEPAPPRDLPSWNARDLVEQLTEKVRERLSTHLDESRSVAPARPGVGIGLAVVILLAALSLGVFGALRDAPPLREGRHQMALGNYSAARAAFVRLGSSIEARKRRALCFVGEGEFGRAFGLFSEVDVLSSLGQFAPHERPIPPPESLGSGAALLPRGVTRQAKPCFVISGQSSGEIRLHSASGGTRSFRFDASNTKAVGEANDHFRVNFPEDWKEPLAGGAYTWELVGQPESVSQFEVLPAERRRAIAVHFDSHLTPELVGAPARFLRAQFFLNQNLLTNAADELAGLVRAFPGASYPASRLGEVCRALDVDPSAFAR